MGNTVYWEVTHLLKKYYCGKSYVSVFCNSAIYIFPLYLRE